jgi:hypothetical protein
MPNPSLKRTAAVEKIANVEMLLAKLRQDFEAATYHRNAVVEDCINKAQDDLFYALSDLLYDDFDSALRITDVVAIRISFAAVSAGWMHLKAAEKLVKSEIKPEAAPVEVVLPAFDYLKVVDTLMTLLKQSKSQRSDLAIKHLSASSRYYSSAKHSLSQGTDRKPPA